MTDKGFSGLTVAGFESRMGREMAQMIVRYNGQPRVAPALCEIPLEDNPEALAFGHRLLSGQVDLLIILTGTGLHALVNVLQLQHSLSEITTALANITLVARGPKPVAALKSLGVRPTLIVPEPNTWHDILTTLDQHHPVQGLRVAVQEYGVPSPELLAALVQRGAQVTRVPVYRWALPEDITPLQQVLTAILAEEVSALLVTSAAQIDHVFLLLEREKKSNAFREACTRLVVASIGPTTSDRLKTYGLSVDLEPLHPKMGILVKETSMQVHELLRTKRST